MAEALSTVSLISFIVAGVCLAAAAFVWIRFNIPAVIGDLTGRTAKKSIAEQRRRNESSGNKSHRPSAINAGRGKITEPVDKADSKTPSLKKKGRAAETARPETGLLTDNKAKDAAVAATELLDANSTEPLDGTEMLRPEAPVVRRSGKPVKLTLLDEETIIHTDETIE